MQREQKNDIKVQTIVKYCAIVQTILFSKNSSATAGTRKLWDRKTNFKTKL